MISTENAHFTALEEKRIAAREAKKLARGRGRKNKR
jgi:ribosome biogenesis GTPase A